MTSNTSSGSIKSIDAASVHRITSGQVVIDLQTAVKELVENSLDAGATSIEVRFKNYGLNSIEVIDNGGGIAESDHDSIGMYNRDMRVCRSLLIASIGRKHHTSKLSSFNDLTLISSFGFRGEALSSLCALCESVTVTTATVEKAPMGTVLELAKSGEVAKRSKAVRQRGTSILLKSPFAPLPVRRKELERNVKREYGKALALLNAYALGPCCGLGSFSETNTSNHSANDVNSTADASESENKLKAVRLIVTNQPDKGQKATHISIPLPRTGSPSVKIGITALWGPKALDGVIDLNLQFEVPKVLPKTFGRKQTSSDDNEGKSLTVRVQGLISSPIPVPGSGSSSRSGAGRSGTDRQFFYINGRPCGLTKIQKVFNETYRSFSPSAVVAAQFPFIVANFTVDGDTVDINVTPDKRTVLLHAESHIIDALKTALEELFQPSRSTFGVNGHTGAQAQGQTQIQSVSVGQARSTSMRPPATTSSLSTSSQAGLNRSASVGSRRRGSMVASRSVEVDDGDDGGEEEEEEEVEGDLPSRVGRDTQRMANTSINANSENDDTDDDDDHQRSHNGTAQTPSASSEPISSASAVIKENTTSLIPPSATPPLAKALVAALDANRREEERERVKDKDKSSVVLKTTNASWNYVQTSSSSAPMSASASAPSPPPAIAIHIPETQDTDTDEDDEPPRKRRRSSAVPNGLDMVARATASGDDSGDEEIDEAQVQGHTVSSSATQGQGEGKAPSSFKARVGKAAASLAGGGGSGGGGSGSGLRQTKLTDSGSFKGGSGSAAARRDMRSKLVGFARVGSQIQQPSSDAEDEQGEEQGEEDQIVEDEDEGKGPRQNDNDSTMDVDAPLFLPGEDDDEDATVPDDMDVDHDATSSSVVSFNTSSVNGPPSSTLATSTLLSSSSEIINLLDDDDDESGAASSSLLSASERDQQLSESRESQPVDRPEVIRTASSQTSDGDVHLRFNLSAIMRRWSLLREKHQAAREKSAKAKDGILGRNRQIADDNDENTDFSDDLQEAEAKLSRVIDKKDFEKMDVIGQFNLGFVIVRRRKRGLQRGDSTVEDQVLSKEDAASLDDLFIVDQHAADEKYNFETLQQTTVIQSQRLFRPQALELTASDELVAIENLDVLRSNGFELEVRKDPDIEMLDNEMSGTQMRSRLSLVAQPVSKSTVFDMKDLEELIHLLQDRPTGQMVRCSKARAMFASRACRKSVMVGMPLTRGQMTTVVHHMGTMDQPWNCPHGRPTMRHLFDMSNMNSDSKPSPRVRKKVDWSTFA
ncbi:hypothetical protein D9758_004384 [Tetrapyrgos nigripes]|uniref:PMS1 n=1 Tax=Tetrapyrgos nigripes TaxID=182062 RepID=A0A8H5LSM5_9AGAR|nr:hypothetical protein D9758_004384 [Tetrapyrgos nigripes]